MTLNDLEPPKYGFLVNSSQFQTVIHILRVNCTETIRDMPGQSAHEMFDIKRRFQRCKVRPRKFKQSSVQVYQIWVPASKCVISATVIQSSKRTVADRQRLAAYHTSTADELSGGTNVNDLKPKKGFLVNFFAKITGDRPRQHAYKI